MYFSNIYHSTVPVYAAECAPPAIRGALVMMWQTWTAFGIMIGTVMDLAFYKVPDPPHVTGLNWRLMLGSVGAKLFPLSINPQVSTGRYSRAFYLLASLLMSRKWVFHHFSDVMLLFISPR